MGAVALLRGGQGWVLGYSAQMAWVNSVMRVGSGAADRRRGKFVVATTDILDKGVASADHSGRAQPFETAHRPQPGFQAAVICFDRIVQVLPHHMTDIPGA